MTGDRDRVFVAERCHCHENGDQPEIGAEYAEVRRPVQPGQNWPDSETGCLRQDGAGEQSRCASQEDTLASWSRLRASVPRNWRKRAGKPMRVASDAGAIRLFEGIVVIGG